MMHEHNYTFGASNNIIAAHFMPKFHKKKTKTVLQKLKCGRKKTKQKKLGYL